MKFIDADYSNSVMWSLFHKKDRSILMDNKKPVVLTSRSFARKLRIRNTDYMIDKVYVDIERITS